MTEESAKRKRILILCLFPHGGAPGQRFRFEQYIPALEAAGFEVEQEAFWDAPTAAVLYQPGHTLRKVRGVLSGFRRRLSTVRRARRYDYVFIHLEAAPIGPPIIESLLFAMKKRVIYDIDDAIFIARTSRVNRLAAGLRWRSKVPMITRNSYRVTAVNPFILEWAKQFNEQVHLLPTTVDTSYHRRTVERRENARPVIGWTGTHSTARHLEIVRPALRALQETHEFTFRVICDVDPDFSELRHYEFIKWTRDSEIRDLEVLDIGLMPVHDEEFSKGKVGFKTIQYGALEIPAIASDVGSGREVVRDGITGYLISNDSDEWLDRMRRMVDDPAGRRQMGRAARRHIAETYTVQSQTPNYVRLFT